MNVTFNINMDAKCVECRKGGASENGLCLKCLTKAMDPKAVMKSDTGRAKQRQLREHFQNVHKS